jgi:DNA uptake protein ComE-like DNA-binding protein
MKGKKTSAVAASGAVALIFLILGFQIAIFSGNVFRFRQQAKAEAGAEAVSAKEAGRSVAVSELDGEDGKGQLQVSAEDERTGYEQGSRHRQAQVGNERDGSTGKSPLRQALEAGASRERDYGDSRTVLAERAARKKAETFEFDPNTVSLDELCRLGFSERQAQVILNYRDKGGRFRSGADFAKMYVVDSAVFERLEPFIRIPKLDLNAADSEALLGLRGIGPYYASKILDYRRRLGGSFTNLDQLLEIDGFTRERLDGFRDDVEVKRAPSGFNIWEATQAQLEAHPYIGSYAAKGILRFKRTVDTLSWSLSALVEAGILTADKAAKLR